MVLKRESIVAQAKKRSKSRTVFYTIHLSEDSENCLECNDSDEEYKTCESGNEDDDSDSAEEDESLTDEEDEIEEDSTEASDYESDNDLSSKDEKPQISVKKLFILLNVANFSKRVNRNLQSPTILEVMLLSPKDA